MLLHRTAGELEIFCDAFVFLTEVDQLYEICNFLICLGGQQPHLGKSSQVIGELFEEFAKCRAQFLRVFVLISRRPRATRKAYLLLAYIRLQETLRQLTLRAP